jgi:putative endonuclease
MSEAKEQGALGEKEALRYLMNLGWKIRASNWRFKKEEIDIIAEDDKQLVFLEVKTRAADTFGSPEDFVSKAQQRHLINAANAYIEKHDLLMETRFDVIAITRHPQFKLKHIREAFHP